MKRQVCGRCEHSFETLLALTVGRMHSPNIVLVMCDQLRRDVLGCMGHPVCRTPHLDRFAAQCVIFDQACTVAPICSPARATAFSGLYPNATGLYFNNDSLPDVTRMVTQDLHDAGYAVHYYGKWHLGTEPAGRGIDCFLDERDYRAWLQQERNYPPDALNANARMHFSPGKVKRETSGIRAEDYFDSWLVDQAVEGLRELDGGEKPYFLTLSLHAPHPPFSVPAPYSTLYDWREIELPASAHNEHEGKPRQIFTEWGWKHANHFTHDDWKDLTAHYWGLVTYLDDQFGRFLDALDRSPARENTIVIFTSDHGDMLGSFRMFGKHNFAYEEVMRIPQMMRVPGLAPRRSEAPVSLVDLVPTILDAAHCPVDRPLHGASMLALARSDRDWPRDANYSSCNIFEHFFLLQKDWKISPEMIDEVDTFKAIRTHRWKYIVHRYGWFEELYDLETDPMELRNLLYFEQGGHDTVRDCMRRQMLRHLMEADDLHAPHFREALSKGPQAGATVSSDSSR